jgi:hypothetical protein
MIFWFTRLRRALNRKRPSEVPSFLQRTLQQGASHPDRAATALKALKVLRCDFMLGDLEPTHSLGRTL